MYCQFVDSDVCMYKDEENDRIVCSVCSFETDVYAGFQYFDTPKEALDHLHEHIKNGDRVPQEVINQLKEEIE